MTNRPIAGHAEAGFGLTFRMRDADATPPKALLVLLHGVGGDASDLTALAADAEPGTLVVLPRGPLTLDQGGYAWFNVAFEPSGPRIAADEAEASRVALIEFITELQEAHEISPRHTFVAGFSQGGILSASVALSAPERVRGFAVLSGRILPELEPVLARREALGQLDGFIAHGRDDTRLPVAWAHRANLWLERLGVPHTLNLYAGGNAISAQMANDFLAWHRSLLSPAPRARLSIDGDETLLAGPVAGEAPLRLAPGADRLVREHFAQRVPMDAAMERAIMAIEEALARVPACARGIEIASDEPSLRRIASAAGLSDDAGVIRRDAIEHLFSRQAAVALGRPNSAEGLPDDPRFVAELLLLREIMHHLDIPLIHLDNGGQSGRHD